MKIKVGDNVKVLSGSSAGKTGKVIQVLVNKRSAQIYVVIEGVNLRKKHIRAKGAGEKGQVIELASPIHMSNVMYLDPNSKKTTRIGYRLDGGNKKRVAKISGAFID